MRDADEPRVEPPAVGDRSSRNPMSVALMAALAFVPIVVAAGFIADRSGSAAVPSDVSVLALRGQFDAAAEKRPDLPMRAGY